MNIAERIAEQLTPVLGAFNAKIWVKTVAQKKGLSVENLDASHVAVVAEGLRQALATFVGKQGADQLVARIQREVF